MKATLFLLTMGLACGQTAPVGDIFQSGTQSAQAEAPLAAYRKLYQLTAQIVQFPAGGYVPPKVDDWPEITSARQQWYASIERNANSMSRKQVDQLVTGSDHLLAAIDDMERGYRIQITQKNWSAQQTVKKLYARAQDEFALCNQNGAKAYAAMADSGANPSSNNANPSALTPADIDAAKMYKLATDMQNITVTALPTQPEEQSTVGVEFLTGAAEWADGTLKMLMEQPGAPVNAASQAIIDFFNRDNNEKYAVLKAAAEQAARSYQENPPRFLGQVAPNFLPMPKVKWFRQLAGVEKSAEEINAVAQAQKQFGKIWNPEAVDPPPLVTEGNGKPLGGFAENSCFATALAQDALWRTDEAFVIKGVQANGTSNLLTKNLQIFQQLAAKFPNAGSESRVFTPEELNQIAMGQPIRSSTPQIGSYLRGRGGNQGLVFVTAPGEIGHVSNVRYFNGRIQYLDVPNNIASAAWIRNPNAEVWFFPTTP